MDFDIAQRARHALGKGPLLLELDLTEPLLVAPPSDPIDAVRSRSRLTLAGLTRTLRGAAADPRVRGLVVRVGGSALGLSQAQEVAQALAAFRRHATPIWAWAETFGEFGPGSAAYLVATEADQIWLGPSGDVGITGPALGAFFAREALDRIGVTVQVGTRHEYKNAPDVALRDDFSEPHREASTALVESIRGQMIAQIVDRRPLSTSDVTALVDRSPVAAGEARDAGLVDHLGYRDQVYATARDAVQRDGSEAELRLVSRYTPPETTLSSRAERKRSVALVQGHGSIRLGRNGGGVVGGPSMGSDSLTAALRAARTDDSVAAVVFRVDSRGGSYVASDTIWREVVATREAGKPVVVSMGDAAASGGYFIAAPATIIVANPATLTGSIGVFGGKPVIRELLERAGIHHDAVTGGRHAQMFSPQSAFTDEEWEHISAWLDAVYDDFVSKVAHGRSMSTEDVHEVARGRVWTGADAADRGLVDELGGLDRALTLARRRAGLPADAPVRRIPAPRKLPRLRPPTSSEDPAAAARSALSINGLIDRLSTALGLPGEGPLMMPPLTLR